MVKTSANAKGTTPVTTGGKSSARPRSADSAIRGTPNTPRSVTFDRVDDRSHGSDDEVELEMKAPAELQGSEDEDELSVVIGKSGASKPIAHRLDNDLDDAASECALAPDDQPVSANRPPVNGDTPNAYRALGQVGRSMTATSAWIMMFAPKEVGGAKWYVLEQELKKPIDSASVVQLAEQTKRLLEAMGFECTSLPSKVALQVWELSDVSAELTKWKRRLKDTFGVRGLSANAKFDETDPRKIPLPETPTKMKIGSQLYTPPTRKDVFSATVESPYFMDSHMVTPKSSRGGRRICTSDDEGDGDAYFADQDDVDDGSPGRRLYGQGGDKDARPFLVTNHVSLKKLPKFVGSRDDSEGSKLWLKQFIYEMEGTNTPKDRWCEPFQLCMKDGARHWVRQLDIKSRRTWSLLREEFLSYYCRPGDQTPENKYYTAERASGEHICDYLLRLNRYARSANIKYSSGGNKGRRHVKHFLNTCRDDDLADLLVLRQFDDIDEVEEVIRAKLNVHRRRKGYNRSANKINRDSGRRSESRDRDDRRGDNRSRRDDRSRQLAIADASAGDLYDALQKQLAITSRNRNDYSDGDDNSSHSDESSKSDSESDGRYMDVAESGQQSRFVNRNDWSSSDAQRNYNRRPRSGDSNRRGQEETGPCAACGDPRHPAHLCYRKCKFCNQFHKSGQCEHYRLYEETSSRMLTKMPFLPSSKASTPAI